MKKNNLKKTRWDKEDYTAIRPEFIKTLVYEYPGKDIRIKVETEEFSAVCPWSGLPDYGILLIEYTPEKVIVELKSLKYYLYSYRSVGIYQEHALNKIFEDLSDIIKPKWLQITLIYNVRGGIKTTVTRQSN